MHSSVGFGFIQFDLSVGTDYNETKPMGMRRLL